MRTRVFLLVTTAGLAVALFRAAPGILSAQTQPPATQSSVALTGHVTSTLRQWDRKRCS